MQFETLFSAADENPVRAGLIGAGEFGLSLIAQSRLTRGLDIVAVSDRDLDATAERLAAAGIVCGHAASPEAAAALVETGAIALCASVEILLQAPLEIVVEATGEPEQGARHALEAIEAGCGVVMVSKEAECVVGPILAAKASEGGVPYTLVDGAPSALLIGLVSWARVLGLPIIAAGKSSEHDFVYDPATHELSWGGRRAASPGLAAHWALGADRSMTLRARTDALSDFPLRNVADYCEMALVANATGLTPDRWDFHAPVARAVELPDLFSPADGGGLLERSGRLDVFSCLRRPDEVGFAGGVFIVVAWPDSATGRLFLGKGIPTSADGRYGLVYNPSHLLGVQAPISIMAAARLDHQIIDASYRPVVDLTARAIRDLPAGHRFELATGGRTVSDLVPGLTPAAAVAGGAPLPYYMAAGQTLMRPVRRGDVITADCISRPTDSVLWDLRAEQDEMFEFA